MLAIAAGCGDGGSSTSSGLPLATTALSTIVPPTTPTTSAPTTTVANERSVAIGQTFSVGVGEPVSVTGAGLSVAFSVVSDNRCPSRVQCIVAGHAVVAVTITRPGATPAKVTLDTDGPTSARSGSRSVELVSLSSGPAPIARLKVT